MHSLPVGPDSEGASTGRIKAQTGVTGTVTLQCSAHWCVISTQTKRKSLSFHVPISESSPSAGRVTSSNDTPLSENRDSSAEQLRCSQWQWPGRKWGEMKTRGAPLAFQPMDLHHSFIMHGKSMVTEKQIQASKRPQIALVVTTCCRRGGTVWLENCLKSHGIWRVARHGTCRKGIKRKGGITETAKMHTIPCEQHNIMWLLMKGVEFNPFRLRVYSYSFDRRWDTVRGTEEGMGGRAEWCPWQRDLDP
jgi:hypothetical protein